MRRLSGLNLVGSRLQELSDPSPPKGIFAHLFGSLLGSNKNRRPPKVELRIRLPQHDFVRAEMFVGDIMEMAGEGIYLRVDELIAILYQDFLATIVKGVNQKQIAEKLSQKKKIYLSRSEKVQDFVKVAPNHWSLTEQVVKKNIKWVILPIELYRHVAFRGEGFLLDLTTIGPDFQMTLEELISILTIDFIAQVRAGNDAKVITRIINNLDSL